MKSERIVSALAVGSIVLALAGGCRKDQHGAAAADVTAHHHQDMKAQSEGRLQVDQSSVLPVDVRAGLMKAYPGATVQNVTKKTYEDRNVRYTVDLTTKDGKHVSSEFDDKGMEVKG